MKKKRSPNLIKPDWIPQKISKITVKKCLASLYSKRVLLNEAHDDIIGFMHGMVLHKLKKDKIKDWKEK